MRKVVAIVLIIAFILPAMPCAAESVSAWVDFSNNKEMQHFSHVSFASETTAVETVNSLTVDGNTCWQMEDGENQRYIRFNIDRSFANGVKDGSEYIIRVEYYDGDIDNEKQGFFSLEYDAIDKACKFGGMVLLTNSGQWKTAEFKLDDAYFGTRLMNRGADFRLTIVPQKSATFSASPVSVAIKKVSVEPTGVKRTVRAVASTGQTGNAFAWDAQEKTIETTLKNTSSNDITADITFKARLDGDKTVYETMKTVTIGANTTAVESINIPLTRCGVYDWVVEIAESNGNFYEKQCMKFAIIKTDKDGIKNDAAYVGHHLDRYFVNGGENREIHEGMELISKSNAGGIRAESVWGQLKPQASSELTFQGTSMELINCLAEQYNLKTTWLLSGGCYAITGGWNSYPDTTEEMNAYKEYVGYTVKNVKNTASSFEVAHEIDNINFNPVIHTSTGESDATPAEYETLIQETASVLKDEKIDKPLIAYGLTNLSDSVTATWLNPALENGILNELDIFSYHPYTYTLCGESAWNLWYFAPRIKEKLQKKNSSTTMAITELGTSLAFCDTYVDGKRSRGANNCRTAIAYTVRGLADFVTQYVFEDKGQLGEIAVEDGFGMVDCSTESLRDDSNAIFVPNDTYLSFTAMNYILGQSEPWQVFELGENISASGFTSNKFNQKVLVLNTVGNKNDEEMYGVYDLTKEVTLQLGVNEITCYDDFGNERILISDTGIYTFLLNERPLYLVGDISQVSLQSTRTFGVNAGNVMLNQTSSVTLFTDGEETYTATLVLPDSVSAKKAVELFAENTRIPLVLTNELKEKSVAEVTICDSQGNCKFFGQITMKQDPDMAFPDEEENFEVKKVCYNAKISNAETSVFSKLSEKFDSYTSANDPGGNKTNTNDYADVSDGAWGRYNHTKESSWWGQGTYVKDGKLCIDNYANKAPISIGASRNLGVNTKDKIYHVKFDMAYYNLEEHNGSSFVLYAGNAPIFGIDRLEAFVYQAQDREQKVKLADTSFDKANYGKDLLSVALLFDFTQKQISVQYGEKEVSTSMSDTFAEEGFSALNFVVHLLEGINPDGTSHNGTYRGNAAVVDNYFEELIAVLIPPIYVENMEISGKIEPTATSVSVAFNDAVNQDTIDAIAVTDKLGTKVSGKPVVSQDGTMISVPVALRPKTVYMLSVPMTVKSAREISMQEEYLFSFATNPAIMVLNANGKELTEEEALNTPSATMRILINPPTTKTGKCMYIYAVYDKANDVLKRIDIKEIAYTEGDVIQHKDSVSVSKDEYAKVFLWHTVGSGMPMEQNIDVGTKIK